MGQILPAKLAMLAHLAQASRRPARSWLSLVPSRQYAAKAYGGPEDPFAQGPTYAQWLRTEAVKYKDPVRAKNWLGGQVVEFVCFGPYCFLLSSPFSLAFPSEPIVQAASTNIRRASNSSME